MLKRTLVSLCVASFMAASPASAAATQESIVAELTEQGFTRIEIGRTLLGRVRVVAYGDGFQREIVFNPGSGVILRDLSTATGSGSGQKLFKANSGSGSGSSNSGSGSSGSGSDDDSDDDDDDDEDDDDDDDDDDDESDD